ncbi:MAG: DUF924 family protein [Gammaproteobacteria bacterium]|nr:DUF924 family protein [Gammaproteobacteria bacterium]
MANVNDIHPDAGELIDFWFSPRVEKLWFNSTPAFDQELRDRYADTYAAACRGECDIWQTSPPGALALVIVFDQIPLNIFRGQQQSFASEARARAVAEKAIGNGFDAYLSDAQKAFLYLPYMHSENLADQDRSVVLYTAAGLENNLRFARHHREIVRRFGRFPHRNAILGRQSTDEELAWLASKDAFKG